MGITIASCVSMLIAYTGIPMECNDGGYVHAQCNCYTSVLAYELEITWDLSAYFLT